jgi:acyl carrier protein
LGKPSINDVVARALNVPVAQITDATSPETLKRWDSLRHLDLITSIEDAYGVRFSTGEISLATSVREIRRLLGEKGIADP